MTDRFLHLPTSVDEALLEATRIGMLAEQTGLPLLPWLVDLDTGSTIAWPADQPIERQVRRP
jgi:hypothetical protein